jgi:hypothetical protein
VEAGRWRRLTACRWAGGGGRVASAAWRRAGGGGRVTPVAWKQAGGGGRPVEEGVRWRSPSSASASRVAQRQERPLARDKRAGWRWAASFDRRGVLLWVARGWRQPSEPAAAAGEWATAAGVVDVRAWWARGE